MGFIALIDYQMGNLRSVQKALEFAGAAVRIASSPAEAAGAAGVLLPGVGNFGEGMAHLSNAGFSEFLRTWIFSGKPFLGICLGMQMLLDSSEEAPGVPGLGIFHGSVRKFPAGHEKIPQIGWNTVRFSGDSPFFHGLPPDPYFYFVHSFYADPADSSSVAGRTDYILDFASALCRGNAAATQFHPEKSQDNGLTILQNFIHLTEGANTSCK